ncbi:Senescence regulator S40 [Dillenia turbinata]|uniref:Senescence regulator S40 n=1 Tax=Dillenia turbinata TaxID=194707 RepID=A0AAN8VM90_9MAGN
MSSPSTIRFLGLLEPPDSDPTPLEFDESDVVWSSDISSSDSADPPRSPSFSSTKSYSPNSRQSSVGLSAAFADDNHRPLLRRKPSLNPSLSAATAAKTIPPVVPVPRSSSSSDEFFSSPKCLHQSAPVNIPVWPKELVSRSKFKQFDEIENDDDDDKDEEMLPPHEIVARSHTTTFSVFEGVGRTLKGRDLRRVRNAVFQKTELGMLSKSYITSEAALAHP